MCSFFENICIYTILNCNYLINVMKEILYVHGYNSSGETGRTLAKLLENDYKVHHFPIPVNADEAINKVKNYLKEHSNISLIVGTSLGGFITSRMNGYLKLMINPCMLPSVELPKLGCEKELANTYKKYEDDLTFLDREEKASTFIMFGTKDELIDYSGYCKKLYRKNNFSVIPGGHHRVSKEELIDWVIPRIKGILEVESKKLYEHFENI